MPHSLDRRSLLTSAAALAFTGGLRPPLAGATAADDRDWSGKKPVRYPDADIVFIDTQHVPGAPPLLADIPVVADFSAARVSAPSIPPAEGEPICRVVPPAMRGFVVAHICRCRSPG